MVIRSEGAVEYVMVGVSRRPTQAIWRGKEIEPVQGDPRKKYTRRNQHWNRFGSVSIHFPLRWALESINGKGKKIGKDLMKRNKRVQFRSWDKAWKEIVPVVSKVGI
ncbi:hypothetical protein TNCV_4339631 [Trichonephila clavipes]|nr:hypothetical protein TNCV_4339631 [Trichonephila clavipes]